MVLQANKWGWRALAARLLLAPVLAGSLALPAFAQPPAAAQTQDPTKLLQMGRQALKDGKHDAAAGYARQAAAANPSGKWGLFGDTPEALIKDTDLARQKADRALAVALTKEARDLYQKGGRTDADRLANLDAAAAKLDKAVTLAGKGDFFDGLNVFADKPDALKREIDSARATLRKANPTAGEPADATAADARGTAPAGKSLPAGVRQAKFELEPAKAAPTGGVAGTKAQAVELVKAGRGLLVDGKLVAARTKFADAAKLAAPFTLNEDTPDKGLQDVAAKGKQKVDDLLAVARGFGEKKEWVKAELALTDAKELATALDLWTREIDLELAAVKKSAGGLVQASAQLPPEPPKADAPKGTEPVKPVDLPPTADQPKPPEPPKVADVPKPVELPKVADTPKPVESPKVADVPKPADLDIPGLSLPDEPPAAKPPAKPEVKPPAVDAKPLPPAEDPVTAAAKKKADEGRKLLDQAADLMKKGDLDAANKLAVQVHNGEFGLKDDAQKLMVAVDAERKAVKSKEAGQALTAAADAVSLKQYAYAGQLLAEIDDSLLPADRKVQYAAMREAVAKEVAKLKAPADDKPADGGKLIPSTPGGGPLDQAKSVVEAEAQQLRAESLQVQSRALKMFEQGDTDQAVQLLADLATKVKASKVPAPRQKALLEPIEQKLDNFRLIKRQVDLYTKDVKEKQERITTRLTKATAEQQRQEEIGKRVADIKELMDKKQFGEAEKVALQAKQLDPDNPTLDLVYKLAKNARRVDDGQRLKDSNEQFVFEGLQAADTLGAVMTDEDPIKLNLKRAALSRGRVSSDELYHKPKTRVEREIEFKLDQAMRVNFKQATLREVLDKFAETAQMNLSVDEPALAAASIELDKVLVSENILHPISLRNILQVILEKHQLQYLVENDMVMVTTLKKAKGRLYTKVFSVMELVTPIPDFALPETYSLERVLQRQATPQQPWINAQAQANAAYGLGGGTLVSGGPAASPFGSGGTGTLQNTPLGGQGHNGISTVAPSKLNHSEQLMKLVKGMVRPHTWDDNGGSGKLAYYDIGGALVVNQTADVISEVNNLLESLRRLQDLSVAVEVRMVSLSESFYERIGVDFQMNIKTNGQTEKFEPSLTTASFRPAPFVNDINVRNVVTGWNPAAGGFTSDLDVPIRPNSYGFSVPPFGGYPGNGNGGLNLGLAFLNDIQVFMFLEAAAGDRRTSVMQAPKITTFNGATATVNVTESAFFVLGLQVLNVGGQFVYLPTNTAVPTGVTVTVQPVVSSDRRFVRMTLAPTLTELTNATVPLFPVTAFITPVFEGGSQGTPIPFTQFFQQPSISTVAVNTTVVVPDGGTVVMGGLKTMSEGRNEFGPPVLSQVPYLNRLFKNTGTGRETRHLMIMVTPRIIITSEEEALATGAGVGLGSGN